MVASRPPFPLLYNFADNRLEECATTLQDEGEKALLQGDQKGLDLLEKAAQLDPLSPRLFFRQGSALFEYGSHQNSIPTLRKAALKFKQATDLNPNLCEAWHVWAATLALIASLIGRQDELIDAKNKIEKALPIASKELAAEMHWDAALIYQKLAGYSGEVDDLARAIAHFEKSVLFADTMPHEFWTEFGNANQKLSEMVQDIRPVIKSIACYKQAISLCLSSFEGWLGLARSLKKLYHFSYESDHYSQACDCFAAASQLKPDVAEVWLERIEFIIEASRRKKESAKLRVAIEKCEQAAILFAPPLKTISLEDLKTSVDSALWNQKTEEKKKPTTAYIHLLSMWAEALALLGEWTNRIELIQEAEQKIDEAYDDSEDEDPFLMNQYGKCLFSFAKYYKDLDLYYQAIEEFQSSLSIDRTQLTCWVWLGKTFTKVYDYTDDLGALENALYFFSKALQIKNEPHFYYEVAKLLIELGQANRTPEPVDEAVSYLEYLLLTYKSIAFDHPEWFFQYGLGLDLQGDIKDDPSYHHRALEAYINVLMFSPSFPKIHYRMGLVYCHLGESLDDPDYLYRALHHFKLASKTQLEDEMLLIDWGVTWIHLSQNATDPSMEENCFREAEQKLIQAALLGSEHSYYHLACLYSLQGSFDLSLSYLHKSHRTKNLPPIEELMDDEWLEGVRFSPQFQEFLALLQKN